MSAAKLGVAATKVGVATTTTATGVTAVVQAEEAHRVLVGALAGDTLLSPLNHFTPL